MGCSGQSGFAACQKCITVFRNALRYSGQSKAILASAGDENVLTEIRTRVASATTRSPDR
eukprot:6135664-Pleurochrysis_carterae.AAC.1